MATAWSAMAAQVFPAATNRANYFYYQNEFGSNVIVRGWLHVDGDITNSSTITAGRVVGNIAVDASGFDGNLATTDTNLQAVAQALDDFTAAQLTGTVPQASIPDLPADTITNLVEIVFDASQFQVTTAGTTNTITITNLGALASITNGLLSDSVWPAQEINANQATITNLDTLEVQAITVGATFYAPGENITYTTNLSTMAPDFAKRYSTITTNDAFTFLAPLNVNAALAQTAVLWVTNSTATAKAVTAPANVHTQGTWYVTNATVFTFFQYGGVLTNAIAFPLW